MAGSRRLARLQTGRSGGFANGRIARERTRTSTYLRRHGPQPCASASSATRAWSLGDVPPAADRIDPLHYFERALCAKPAWYPPACQCQYGEFAAPGAVSLPGFLDVLLRSGSFQPEPTMGTVPGMRLVDPLTPRADCLCSQIRCLGVVRLAIERPSDHGRCAEQTQQHHAGQERRPSNKAGEAEHTRPLCLLYRPSSGNGSRQLSCWLLRYRTSRRDHGSVARHGRCLANG